ncbi:MAG TPA: PilZ domain-containing protein [Steroidobacteraceae bacterium]|nr:PilZ domain-containing protein [Steroidobacteraceae bacterium]
MYEGTDTTILYEELAYHDVLPIEWRSLADAQQGEGFSQLADRNLRLLQACLALEEHGHTDKTDDHSPHAADIQRLDMKMNLLLDLVGRILRANHPRPAALNIKFNVHGAAFVHRGAPLGVGEEGVLDIYLQDSLVEPLRMIGRIASVSPEGAVKVKFATPGDTIGNLIEKLAFRHHRRQIADARHPRKK